VSRRFNSRQSRAKQGGVAKFHAAVTNRRRRHEDRVNLLLVGLGKTKRKRIKSVNFMDRITHRDAILD
jgi:hypothetical protein